MRRLSTRDWKIAPSAAVPVAIPTWRNVVLMPEPMPLRARGTTPTAVWASAGLTIPMPMPTATNPGMSAVHSESVLTARIISRATPTSPRPAPKNRRMGNWAANRPATGATKNEISDSGRKYSPASSGSAPSTPWR